MFSSREFLIIERKATEVSSPRKILRENIKTQGNIQLSYDCLLTYDCYLLNVVYLLTIVAFSSSSRGSDCNRDASFFPVLSLCFYCISIVYPQ